MELKRRRGTPAAGSSGRYFCRFIPA